MDSFTVFFLKKNKKPYISYFKFHKTIIFNEYPYSQNSYNMNVYHILNIIIKQKDYENLMLNST